MNTQPLHNLLYTEMDRKEFLAYLGGVILAILGVSGLLRSLTSTLQPRKTGGYGSSPYGGKD